MFSCKLISSEFFMNLESCYTFLQFSSMSYPDFKHCFKYGGLNIMLYCENLQADPAPLIGKGRHL